MPAAAIRTIGSARRVPYSRLYRSVPDAYMMTPARREYAVKPPMPLRYRQPTHVKQYYTMTAKKPRGFGTRDGNRIVGGMYLRLKSKLKKEIKKAETAVKNAEKAANAVANFEINNGIEELDEPARRTAAPPTKKPRARASTTARYNAATARIKKKRAPSIQDVFKSM